MYHTFCSDPLVAQRWFSSWSCLNDISTAECAQLVLGAGDPTVVVIIIDDDDDDDDDAAPCTFPADLPLLCLAFAFRLSSVRSFMKSSAAIIVASPSEYHLNEASSSIIFILCENRLLLQLQDTIYGPSMAPPVVQENRTRDQE